MVISTFSAAFSDSDADSDPELADSLVDEDFGDEDSDDEVAEDSDDVGAELPSSPPLPPQAVRRAAAPIRAAPVRRGWRALVGLIRVVRSEGVQEIARPVGRSRFPLAR
ncbi:hypothetical protein [Janibacter sp. GS2]|uniref:hypothetical protein n=1 Tax=Janibacter sp. GS2 TaxID=3442646 RepID=UPI003EB8B50F